MELETLQNEIKSAMDNITAKVAEGATQAEVTALDTEIKALRTQLDTMEAKANRPVMDSKELDKDIELKTLFDANAGKSIELKTVSGITTTAAEGGNAIIPEFYAGIISALRIKSPVRQYANIVPVSSNVYSVPTHDANFAITCGTESTDLNNTEAGAFGLAEIAVKMFEGAPGITEFALNSRADFFSWISAELVDAVASAEGKYFITGDGVTQPQGLILSTNSVTRIDSATASVIGSADIDALYFGLKSQYAANAVWLMNRKTKGVICALKATTGQPLFATEILTSNTLYGRPIVECDSMPDVADNANAVLFGDLKAGYWIVDQTSMKVNPNPYRTKGITYLDTTKMTGGGVVKPEAIKILKIKAAG